MMGLAEHLRHQVDERGACSRLARCLSIGQAAQPAARSQAPALRAGTWRRDDRRGCRSAHVRRGESHRDRTDQRSQPYPSWFAQTPSNDRLRHDLSSALKGVCAAVATGGCRSGSPSINLNTARRSSSVVEQGTHKPLVGGSNPPSATTPRSPERTRPGGTGPHACGPMVKILQLRGAPPSRLHRAVRIPAQSLGRPSRGRHDSRRYTRQAGGRTGVRRISRRLPS